MRVCVAYRIGRRRKRSATTPEKGPRKRPGIWLAKTTMVSQKGLPSLLPGGAVIRLTSHAMAVVCIQVPMSDNPCPMKNRRKLRCASERRMVMVEPRRGGGP